MALQELHVSVLFHITKFFQNKQSLTKFGLYNENDPFQLDFSIVPKTDYMQWWLEEYLKVYKTSETVCEGELSEWVESVKLMMPLSHLYWGTWSLMQVTTKSIPRKLCIVDLLFFY